MRPNQTVAQALDTIRTQPLDSAIVYFYVLDDERRLQGVVPTRRLLTSNPGAPVASVMNAASITLPVTATLREAAAMLVRHRLLAVPVVGRRGRMHGVLDATALGIDIAAEMNGRRVDELFQLIGVHVTDGAPRLFRARFPPLLWNVVGGLMAALIAGAHEHALRAFTALALFMPVTLALSESIGMQAVMLALQDRRALRTVRPWWALVRSLAKEGGTALRLAVACAVLVALVLSAWQREAVLSLALLLSIATAMTAAGVVGAVTPRVLYAMRRNPHVAAGPTVLAVADIVSLVFYFRVATALL